ncbi:hypothetical protein AYL99_11845 [Fonsecaea erecta]|uniref:Uncharacterized protein n=1 Tax=Fonsecaea erecta TaxID=1367422 RepID=A0A178Z4E0_9EURO|nr:hypothetical protein AYL99_11845 [Fonsecaea erecta]OAP53965.1 hypothetical protein AYL99_11845 [Fonsecaea erecta]
MNPRPDNALEPGAPDAALASLSLSDGDTVATSASASLPQPSEPTHPDQLHELMKFAEAVATDKLRLTPDDEPVEFTIFPKSWDWLEDDLNFELYIEGKLFRYFYERSRHCITIIPYRSHRHQSFVRFLMELAYKTKKSFTSLLADTSTRGDRIRIEPDAAVCTVLGHPDEKVADLSIQWAKGTHKIIDHTIVEASDTQSLDDLRYLARFYLYGHHQIQRVVLIAIAETPRFESPNSVDASQEFRTDESTGVIWFGNVKAIGEMKITWEVWERDTAGAPQPTFQEVFAFGEIPSRDLPFLKVRGGPHGNASTWEYVNASVTPQMIKDFWMKDWPRSIWEDARRRMLPLLGEQRLEEAWEEFRRARNLDIMELN